MIISPELVPCLYLSASQKTCYRRTRLIDQFRAIVTANDTTTQLQHEVRSLGKDARQELLRSAGVTLEIPAGAGLAMKADCSLPWLRLRKIRRYNRACVCRSAHMHKVYLYLGYLYNIKVLEGLGH